MRPLFLLLSIHGCSLSIVESELCDSDASCRDAFGFGSVCIDDGTCETAEFHPRCTLTYPEGLSLPIDTSSTFVIGTIFDHSLETHIGRYQSAQLALKQANDNGGLEGHDFAIIHCTNTEDAQYDDLGKTEATVAAATFLSDVIGAPAIVGPAASSRSEAVYNEVSTVSGMLLVSPSATSPTLTPLDGATSTDEAPGLLWRTAPPDDLQASTISTDMLHTFDAEGINPDVFRTAPSQNVGVVYQTGSYGEGMNTAFSGAHDSNGGTSTGYSFDNSSDLNDAIIDALDGNHDEILFVSSDSSDVVAFLQAAGGNANAVGLPIFLTDSAHNADVLNANLGAGDDLLPQLRGTAPARPEGIVYQAFVSGYSTEFNGADVTPLSFTPHAFDAAWLILYGHAWALGNEEEISGTTIARGFRKVSSGENVPIRASSWNSLKASFASGTTIDVSGASGSLDYDLSTGETRAAIDIWRVVVPPLGGERSFETVATVE